MQHFPPSAVSQVYSKGYDMFILDPQNLPSTEDGNTFVVTCPSTFTSSD